MDKREETVRQWFAMWLEAADEGLEDIFEEDAVYIESWGPAYCGLAKIKHWFAEWNTRGKVLQWDIKQFFHRDNQTVVLWSFKDQMEDGKAESFEGVSLIRWTEGEKISYLQEFGCNESRYDPYQDGGIPRFRDEKAKWF